MQFVCHFGAKFKERVEMKYQFSLISNNDMFEFGIVSKRRRLHAVQVCHSERRLRSNYASRFILRRNPLSYSISNNNSWGLRKI